MSYAMTDEEDNNSLDEIKKDLPDLDEMRSYFEACHENKPNPVGYAVFSTDDMGVGVFNFCDTVQQFYALCEATTFMEAFDEGYETYTDEKLKELWVAFYLSNSFGSPEALHHKGLMEDLNCIMDRYRINFMGPVKDLFVPNTEFTSQLIEEFGKNPLEFPDEYMEFLADYVWG